MQGARGGELAECAGVAAKAVSHFAGQLHEGGGLVLRFAVVEPQAEGALSQAFSDAVRMPKTHPKNKTRAIFLIPFLFLVLVCIDCAFVSERKKL